MSFDTTCTSPVFEITDGSEDSHVIVEPSFPDIGSSRFVYKAEETFNDNSFVSLITLYSSLYPLVPQKVTLLLPTVVKHIDSYPVPSIFCLINTPLYSTPPTFMVTYGLESDCFHVPVKSPVTVPFSFNVIFFSWQHPSLRVFTVGL